MTSGRTKLVSSRSIDARRHQRVEDRLLGLGGDGIGVLQAVAQRDVAHRDGASLGYAAQSSSGRDDAQADGRVAFGDGTSTMRSSTSSHSVRSARDITACCR